MSPVGQALVLAACALTLLSGIGVVRFSDVFIRMHALSKASTLGVGSISSHGPAWAVVASRRTSATRSTRGA